MTTFQFALIMAAIYISQLDRDNRESLKLTALLYFILAIVAFVEENFQLFITWVK